MTRLRNSAVCKSPLSMRRAHQARTRDLRCHAHLLFNNLFQPRVIGYEEIRSAAGCRLKSLQAVPGHVLDADECSVGKKQEVKEAVANEYISGRFYDVRKGPE